MNRIPVLLTAVAAFGVASYAAAPIATVSSPEPVTLAGHSLSAPGVSSWPLVAGDEISTSTASATILFKDGSSVALASKSSARLTGTSTQPKLVLTAGSLNYRLVAGSKVALSRSVPDNDGTSSGGQTPAGPPSGAAASSGAGVSTGAIVAAVASAAAIIAVVPIETATHSTPPSLPPISTH